MATEAENLATALANVATKLAEVTSNPKPSYSVDGRSVSWGDYYKSLVALRDSLKAALIDAEGPYERHIQGTS